MLVQNIQKAGLFSEIRKVIQLTRKIFVTFLKEIKKNLKEQTKVSKKKFQKSQNFRKILKWFLKKIPRIFKKSQKSQKS